VLGNDDLYPRTDKVPDYVKQSRRRRAEFFERFAKIMGQLEGIAAKELRAKPLDVDEKKLLKDAYCHSAGSWRRLRSDHQVHWPGTRSSTTMRRRQSRATSRTCTPILTVACSWKRAWIRALSFGRRRQPTDRAVYVGPGYSYYEFTSPLRLTTRKWTKAIPTTPPASFTSSFALPAVRRSMIYPPKAPPPAPPPPAVSPPAPSPPPDPTGE